MPRFSYDDQVTTAQSKRTSPMRARWLAPTVAGLLLLSVGAGTGIGRETAAGTHPRARAARTATMAPPFTPGACPFKPGKGLTAGTDIRCGYVTVPADHAKPTGATIKLPVAIFKSHSAQRQPDPVLSLQGGPGGSWVGVLGPAITARSEPLYVGDRDLVLVDQRGTGFAQPSLACSPPAAKRVDPLQRTTPAQAAAQQEEIYAQCHDELVGKGIDLSVYNTVQDARDVDAVRAALGYNKVNLYGVSYGTELAQVVMRLYPAHIRSVVLDSVEPVQNSLLLDETTNPARGLRTLFAGCAASPACNAAFPHLDATFDRTVRRLDAHPVVIATLDLTGTPARDPTTGKPARSLLTGQAFAGLITQAQYVAALIPVLPFGIARTAAGNYRFPGLLAGVSAGIEKTINRAMFYSVVCSEDAPYTTPGQIAAAAALAPPESRHALLVGQQSQLTLCRRWGVTALPPSFKAPLRSAIPTLLLEGAYDPITPVTNARAVAAGLHTHTLVLFPAYGHGEQGSGPCPSAIIQSFQDHPTAKPNTTCAMGLSGPAFLTKAAS